MWQQKIKENENLHMKFFKEAKMKSLKHSDPIKW